MLFVWFYPVESHDCPPGDAAADVGLPVVLPAAVGVRERVGGGDPSGVQPYRLKQENTF